MKGNDLDTEMARATASAARALDYAAIEARARQLRSQTLRALFKALVRRAKHAWTAMTQRPSEVPCTHRHTAACNCAE